MKIGRFFLWSVLAGISIAGGLFVSDQRVVKPSASIEPSMISGNPLRLGVVLSEVPGTARMNQAISHTLLLARNHVNQCGGINQAPVFLTIGVPEETKAYSDDIKRPRSKKKVTIPQEAIAREAQTMNQLIQAQDIHGAIVTFTIEPNSYGLTSKALDTAIDFNIPTISPANTYPLLAKAEHSPFDRFRLELSKVEPNASDNRHNGHAEPSKTSMATAEDRIKKTRTIQMRPHKSQYWSRTMMSDRQYLMMVAQLAHHERWERIVTIGPDSDRGAYLETLLAETVQTWSGTVMTDEQFLHYQVTPSDSTLSSLGSPLPSSESSTSTPQQSGSENFSPVPPLESTAANISAPLLSAIDVAIDADALVFQQPDAIILFLEPGMFSDLSWPPLTETPSSKEEPSNISQPDHQFQPNKQFPPQSRVTLKPSTATILGIGSPETVTPQNNPLPYITNALMNQLGSVVNIEETPILLGNLLDAQDFLNILEQRSISADLQTAIAHAMATESSQRPSSEPPSHPLNGLHGILPLPTQSPHRFLSQTSNTKQFSNDKIFNSAIAPATWDAAVMMMLAAEVAGYNHKEAIQKNLRNVANPPGIEVTDVCEALKLIRQGQSINYQGISGRVDLDGWGNVNPPQNYKLWKITPTGVQQTIETLIWEELSSSTSLPQEP